jgi:uncharacterized protein
MNDSTTLIVMARPPEKGKVKTRLAADLGEEKTLVVYKALLEKLYSTLHELTSSVSIFWTHFPYPSEFNAWTNAIQSDGDLGKKMHSAFEHCGGQSSQSMVMIGTDCYDLDAERIRDAFEALKLTDVVIGPAMDGGYYLIGMKRLHSDLFQEMPWSTSHLLEITIARMRDKGLGFILLPTLRDIDEVADAMATDGLRPYLI